MHSIRKEARKVNACIDAKCVMMPCVLMLVGSGNAFKSEERTS